MSFLLNRETILFEELEILHHRGRGVEVDQDADTAAHGRLENGAKKADQIEGRELTFLRVEQNVPGEAGWLVVGITAELKFESRPRRGCDASDAAEAACYFVNLHRKALFHRCLFRPWVGA